MFDDVRDGTILRLYTAKINDKQMVYQINHALVETFLTEHRPTSLTCVVVTVWPGPGSRGLAGCSTSDWADELMIETIRNRELLCRLCDGGG